MKLQAVDLPLMKNQNYQTRRKTPKIAPLIALALFLLTVIPIYYPLLGYPNKKISSESSSSQSIRRESLPDRLCRDDLTKEDGSCSHKDVEGTPIDTNQDSPTTVHGGDVEEPPALSDPERDVEAKRNVKDRDLDLDLDLDLESDHLVSVNDRDGETKSAVSNRDLVVVTAHPRWDTEELPIGESAATTSTNRESATTNRDRDVKIIPGTSSKERVTTHRRRDVGRLATGSLGGDSPGSGKEAESAEKCDVFSGDWVPNPEAPYYTNRTCREIQEHQNCMKFGRPDNQYLKWRWKPDGCELPVFDPFQFLELVRGKSMAFVGDSVARNHMQSLLCLLSRVEEPVDVSEIPYGSQFKRYEFRNNNFTVEIFWSPYLVRTTQSDPSDAALTRPFNLFLDEFDEQWTTKIEGFDFVIISAGHWFFRPTMFFVEGRVVGCLYCPESNITHLTTYFSYRRAFRTAFRAINSLENYKGITFLRTFAPSHFEGGYWDKGGDCARRRPWRSGEARLDGYNLELYEIQMQELKIAERLGRRKGLKFRLFDVTKAMLLRPDGHPSKYGHWSQANVSLANDCVHWCLPGPVDTWNDFLMELLKREEKEVV
ncbi:hypothetical protein U1Q18_012152 [Sarracenia purpurea var. burkii]